MNLSEFFFFFFVVVIGLSFSFEARSLFCIDGLGVAFFGVATSARFSGCWSIMPFSFNGVRRFLEVSSKKYSIAVCR